MVKSLIFRKRISETINRLEDEIKASLLNEGKEEIISGDFKVSVRDNGHVEIIELPPLNLEQLELPLNTRSKESKKG